jgi:tRNA pseudouridine55 synthase
MKAMNKLIAVDKPSGATPLQVIKKLREQLPEYKDESISYAGRLDPLAHGVLLLMIGDATKEREKYLSFPKTYEFDVLFGIETDTYDLLGIPQINLSPVKGEGLGEGIKQFMQHHIGIHIQTYPPYSSKTVNGKPLFQWAREDKLDEIVLPLREIEITKFEMLGTKELSNDEVKSKVHKAIDSVSGDFRQKAIREAWDTVLQETKNKTFTIVQFRIQCSSGTYVRQLVHTMGRELGTGAVTLDIFRTKVGDYGIDGAIKLS